MLVLVFVFVRVFVLVFVIVIVIEGDAVEHDYEYEHRCAEHEQELFSCGAPVQRWLHDLRCVICIDTALAARAMGTPLE